MSEQETVISARESGSLLSPIVLSIAISAGFGTGIPQIMGVELERRVDACETAMATQEYRFSSMERRLERLEGQALLDSPSPGDELRQQASIPATRYERE